MSDESGPTSRGHRELDGSHYQPAPPVALALLVLFVASVIAVVHFVSPVSIGGGGGASTTTTAPSGSTTTTTFPPRSAVKVQVANGTTIPNLAKAATDALVLRNWGVLGPVNANAAAAKTVIYYRSGYRWAAKQVARTLKEPLGTLSPLGTATPVAGTSGDDVIVVLGPDATTK
jgi:hypothetical protein